MTPQKIRSDAPTGFPENRALRAWFEANGIAPLDVIQGPLIGYDTGVVTYQGFVRGPDGERSRLPKKAITDTQLYKHRTRRAAIKVPPSEFGLVTYGR
jgi:hypothetical protein